MSLVEDLTAVEDSADYFLAKTIRSMEEKMSDTRENVVDSVCNDGDDEVLGDQFWQNPMFLQIMFSVPYLSCC